MKDLGVIGKKKRVYCPDLVAKKDDKIYIIEVKTQKALRYLKKELDWLMLAKEYGFSPVVATVNVNIEARDLVLEES
jgi:Holliday junction resolvase